MSYFPTFDEIQQLGFKQGIDEDGNDFIYLEKELGCILTLENDEGVAMAVEWLPDGIHAWVVCACFDDLKNAVENAFSSLAEGRSKTPLLF